MFPTDPKLGTGDAGPHRATEGMGPETHSWLVRQKHVFAPMGPRAPLGAPPFGTVLTEGYGSNVWDADGNRYVDLAAGFGAMLVGHGNPYVVRALRLQAPRLMQAMGDLYASDARIGLSTQLAALYPDKSAQVILGQSGSDAVSAALKTALLATGKPGVVAFEGSYHGLSYGPLAACGLRESYRAPFSAQLNPNVHFLPYPNGQDGQLEALRRLLRTQEIGALLFEPVLGRGGIRLPPTSWCQEAVRLAREFGVIAIADEIWTGLGRCGRWFASFDIDRAEPQTLPDLVCLGKGLGGGLPLSAVVGRKDVLSHWSRAEEVVHTSTFAGAPLACATAVATLDVLRRFGLVETAASLGERFLLALEEAMSRLPVEVRGSGLMLGIDLGARPGAAALVMAKLLEQGYLVSTGGGKREVVVLTPALTITEECLSSAVAPIAAVVAEVCTA